MCIPKSKMIVLLCLLVIVCAGSKVVAADDTITGEGTANYIPKFTDTYKVHNSTIYESSGNIGIGTTSPGFKLDVAGAVNSDSFRMNDATRYLVYTDWGPATGQGLYWDTSSDLLSLMTGSTARLTINQSGNVGIGTTSPGRKLELYTDSGASINNFIRFKRANTGPNVNFGAIEWADNAGVNWQIGSGLSGTTQGLYFAEGDAADIRMTIDIGGNVGIGTTNPGFKLDVAGAVNSDSFRMNDATRYLVYTDWGPATGQGLYWDTSSDLLSLMTGSTARLTINQSGNVGIGTTSPNTKLEVKTATAGSGHDIFRVTAAGGAYVSNTGSDASNNGYFTLRNSANSDTVVLHTNGNSYLNGGNVGIGETNPSEKLTVRGNILVKDSSGNEVVELGTGLDYSEGFNVSDKKQIMTGCVVVIDADNPGKLTVSTQPYDSKVAGIVAGAKGLGSGVRLGIDGFDCDVALAGRVYCNVDATEEAVQPGDLLTTSATDGYAMKAADYMRAHGAILGKAMESLEQGKKGQILVLVTLQ